MMIAAIWCVLICLVACLANRCGIKTQRLSVCLMPQEQVLSDWEFMVPQNSTSSYEVAHTLHGLETFYYHLDGFGIWSSCCNQSDLARVSKLALIDCFEPSIEQTALKKRMESEGKYNDSQVACTSPLGKPGGRFCQLPDGDFFMETTDSEIKSCVENLLSLQINASKVIIVICEQGNAPLRFEDIFVNNPEHVAFMFRVFPWFMLASSICLVLTVIVYVTIGRFKHLYDQVTLCHLTSLLFIFVGYMVIKFRYFAHWLQEGSFDLRDDLCSVSCVIFGIGAYFSFLSTFTWGGIVSLDLWITYGLFIKKRIPRVFRLYLFCGFGIPAVMTLFVVIMDVVPYLPENIIRPGIIRECWITVYLRYDAELVYLFVPLGIITACNFVLFVHTTVYFLHDVATAATATTARVTNIQRYDKQRYFVVTQVFVIMGVGWVIDVITWWAKAPSSLRMVHEVLNISRGSLMFAVHVLFKPDIRNQFVRCCKSALKKLECGKPKDSQTTITLS